MMFLTRALTTTSGVCNVLLSLGGESVNKCDNNNWKLKSEDGERRLSEREELVLLLQVEGKGGGHLSLQYILISAPN